MNRKQRIVILAGICLVTLAGLVPPWRLIDQRSYYDEFHGRLVSDRGDTVTLRYGWLFVPPHYTRRVYLHASRAEIKLYQAAKAAADSKDDLRNNAEWDETYGPAMYAAVVETFEERIRKGEERAALGEALKCTPNLIVTGFENVHGRPRGPVQATFWWETVPWSAVAPRLDISRLCVEWVLIALVIAGFVMALRPVATFRGDSDG